MKTVVAFLALVACMGLVFANEVRIQDVKVITPQGVFEEVKKQELEDGNVVSCETLRVKEVNPEKEEKSEEPSSELTQMAEISERRRLLNLYIKHLKLAKMLKKALLDSSPVETKVKAVPRTRVFIIRIPFEGFSFPRILESVRVNPGNVSDRFTGFPTRRSWISTLPIQLKVSSNETTPVPPTDDQIPPPPTTTDKPMTS